MTMQNAEECQLLEEGAQSYVPAFSAILAFQELVHSRCRQVLQQHLAEYSAALGVPLGKSQILPHQRPRPNQWDGKFAFLGFRLGALGEARAEPFGGLYWELGEEGNWHIQVGSGIWVSNRAHIERARQAFRSHPPNLCFSDSEKEIWVYEPITSTELGTFESKLDNILARWIKLWKRAGGLKVLAKDS